MAKFEGKYFYSIGRRKEATAIVKLYPEGRDLIYINDRELSKYFPSFEFQKIVKEPLEIIKEKDNFNIAIKVSGGGFRGQAEAIRLGVARALIEFKGELRPILKKASFLTRDPRVKERKKPGLKRARRAPQFSKR